MSVAPTLAVVVTGWQNRRVVKTEAKATQIQLGAVHAVVNSQHTEALERIKTLEATVRQQTEQLVLAGKLQAVTEAAANTPTNG